MNTKVPDNAQRSAGPRRDAALAPSGTSRPERQRRRPRLPEFSYRGAYAYHVTIVTHGRAPIFTEPLEAEPVLDHLKSAADQQGFSLLAYCLMPDHLHLLVQGNVENSNLLSFIQRLKQLSGFDFKQRNGQPLWQQSFHDHAIRRDEDLAQVAAYIVANPIEAGLVADEGFYPWIGGEYYTQAAADGAKAASLRESISRPEGFHD